MLPFVMARKYVFHPALMRNRAMLLVIRMETAVLTVTSRCTHA
jgi:hypothetical protein